jgi:hypothetical protein
MPAYMLQSQQMARRVASVMLQHLLQAVVCTTVCMLHNKTGISSASSMPNLRCIKLGPQQCYEHYIFHICLLSSPATSHKRVSRHTHSPQVLGVVCTLGFSMIWRVFFGCNPSGVPFCMCCGSAAVAAACGSFYCNAEYLTIKVFLQLWRLVAGCCMSTAACSLADLCGCLGFVRMPNACVRDVSCGDSVVSFRTAVLVWWGSCRVYKCAAGVCLLVNVCCVQLPSVLISMMLDVQAR